MQDKSKMYVEYYHLLEMWMKNLEKGKSIQRYFDYYGYKNIALYGIGKMASHVINELKDSETAIAYAIDQNTGINSDIDIISCNEEEFPAADVLIVTPIYDFEIIERRMREILDVPIVSLKEVIQEAAIL